MVVSSLIMASLAERRQQKELETIIFSMKNMTTHHVQSPQTL